MIVFVEPLLALFGPDFAGGADQVRILATMACFSSFSILAGYAVFMSGRSGIVMFNALVQALVTVGLCLVLIPRHGGEGAAIARTAGLGSLALLAMIESRMFLGVLPIHVGMLKSLVASLVAAALVALIASRVDLVAQPVLTILLVLAFVGLYGLQVAPVRAEPRRALRPRPHACQAPPSGEPRMSSARDRSRSGQVLLGLLILLATLAFGVLVFSGWSVGKKWGRRGVVGPRWQPRRHPDSRIRPGSRACGSGHVRDVHFRATRHSRDSDRQLPRVSDLHRRPGVAGAGGRLGRSDGEPPGEQSRSRVR